MVFEPFLDEFWVEEDGAGAADECDPPLCRQDVEAFGPRGVVLQRIVAHRVDEQRKRELRGVEEVLRDGESFRKGHRLLVADAVGLIVARAPLVVGVGFFDVDREEIGGVVPLLLESCEAIDRAPKGSSSEAAEYQDHGAIADVVEEFRRLAVRRDQPDVGRGVTQTEWAHSRLRRAEAQEAEGGTPRRQAESCRGGHGNEGDPESFSVPHFKDKVIEYLDPESTDGGKLTREEALFTNQKLGQIRSLPRGAAFESPVAKDADYADGRVAAETINRLRAAKKRRTENDTPFFIATGFVRPHLPFSAPKKYWDLHDPATLPMPKYEQLPKNAPAVAGKRGGEIAAYKPVTAGDIGNELKRQLIHGYYASTSYVDAQIGKVISEVDRLGLADDTIIVLWGDHGFHLGDLGIWTKHTNYEQANRIPILIVAPGVTRRASSTRQLAESVDIFPTLAELAGLPAPKGPQPIDGISLVPVLKDPTTRVRNHAFHAYPRGRLGRAIRTERYRLVEWRRPGEPEENAQYELYDYQSDPLERENLAVKNPGIMKALKATLAKYPVPFSRSRKRK